MKKAVLVVAIVLIGAIFAITGYSPRETESSRYQKIISQRLSELTGLVVFVEKVEFFTDRSEIHLSNVSFRASSNAPAFFFIGKLAGKYDVDKLSENELFIDTFTTDDIKIPMLETKSLVIDDKVNQSFYHMFTDWKSKENIKKIVSEMQRFYESQKKSTLNQSLRNLITISDKYTKTKKDLKTSKAEKDEKIEELKTLAKSEVQSFLKAKETHVDLKKDEAENFFQGRSFLVKVAKIFEIDLLKKFFDKELKNTGVNITRALRNIYKAQFYQKEGSADYPHLSIGKIKFFEKEKIDSKKALIGHINNLSSKHSRFQEAMKVNLLGDFEKYGIKGISVKIGIYKDDNKVVTFQLRADEFPIKEYMAHATDKNMIYAKNLNGNLHLGGVVHKSDVRVSLTYKLNQIEFSRSPLYDNLINEMLDIYEKEKNKNIVLVMQKAIGGLDAVHVEYGERYLSEPLETPSLVDAYYEDVLANELSSIKIDSSDFDSFILELSKKLEEHKRIIFPKAVSSDLPAVPALNGSDAGRKDKSLEETPLAD